MGRERKGGNEGRGRKGGERRRDLGKEVKEGKGREGKMREESRAGKGGYGPLSFSS